MAPFKYVFRKFWICARRFLLLGGPLKIGGSDSGEFFPKIGEDMREYQKNDIGRRKLWENFSRNLEKACANIWQGENYGGISSRNLEKICANFKRKQYWWEETMGEFFQKFREDMREFQKTLLDYWREETMGEFFQKFGEDMREFPKNNIGRRKLWENFSRNLEQVCANFKAIILAGGNYGGFFPEIGEDMCEFQKETILAGGNYGVIFQKFGAGMRECQKN